MSHSSVFVNKRLLHRFSLLKTWESGIVLSGQAVKLIFKGQFDLSKTYIFINQQNELWITNWQFSGSSNDSKQKPSTEFKLLLNKKEILLIKKGRQEKGLTIIATKLYWKKNKIKLQIALAKGLKKYDKKQQLIAKDLQKQNKNLGKIFDL